MFFCISLGFPVGLNYDTIAFSICFCLLFQDIVILNKVDLVLHDDPENLLEELEKEIHNINSLVNIIHATRCQVELSMILNCQAYDATVSLLIFLYVS